MSGGPTPCAASDRRAQSSTSWFRPFSLDGVSFFDGGGAMDRGESKVSARRDAYVGARGILRLDGTTIGGNRRVDFVKPSTGLVEQR